MEGCSKFTRLSGNKVRLLPATVYRPERVSGNFVQRTECNKVNYAQLDTAANVLQNTFQKDSKDIRACRVAKTCSRPLRLRCPCKT